MIEPIINLTLEVLIFIIFAVITKIKRSIIKFSITTTSTYISIVSSPLSKHILIILFLFSKKCHLRSGIWIFHLIFYYIYLQTIFIPLKKIIICTKKSPVKIDWTLESFYYFIFFLFFLKILEYLNPLLLHNYLLLPLLCLLR